MRGEFSRRNMRWGKILVIGIFVLATLSLSIAVTPFGADTITPIKSETSTPDPATSVQAQAGNVTELNIIGNSVTQTWQGYYGNVSGTIMLADSSDNVMYNWSLADPEGEIYASRDSSVSWANIECFNWTENGTWLENNFSIASDDVDGVNETFNQYNHSLFYSNNIEFAENSCMSAMMFDNSGSSTDGVYEEVLLWDGDEVVFTSLLEENSVLGFDGRDHDFEMLVLEDGHGTDTSTTPYYFYVELQ